MTQRTIKALALASMLSLVFVTQVFGNALPDSLAYVDLKTAGDVVTIDGIGIVKCESFNPLNPGSWGGNYPNAAVTAFPNDLDDAGYCTFSWSEGMARLIKMSVLDGLADDSFEVYVKNPAGRWALVYTYDDQYSTETWVTHEILSFPAGKGQGPSVEIMIIPTNVGWSGFGTWGQLAVDWIAVFGD